jgi:hypothetical protein
VYALDFGRPGGASGDLGLVAFNKNIDQVAEAV